MANALGLARYGQRAFADVRKKTNALNVVGFDPGFGGFKVVAAA